MERRVLMLKNGMEGESCEDKVVRIMEGQEEVAGRLKAVGERT